MIKLFIAYHFHISLAFFSMLIPMYNHAFPDASLPRPLYSILPNPRVLFCFVFSNFSSIFRIPEPCRLFKRYPYEFISAIDYLSHNFNVY